MKATITDHEGRGNIQEGKLAGHLIVAHDDVQETYNAGFSMYVAAWPLLQHYPGNLFQTGLFGTWMFAQNDTTKPHKNYSDIEGGRFSGRASETWKLYDSRAPQARRQDMLPLHWKSFAMPVAPDKNRSFGYRWDDALVTKLETKDGPLVTIPQYYRLTKDASKEAEWIPVLPQAVPAETGLKDVNFSEPLKNTSDPYLTPDSPDSCWKKPGPVAGPFQAYPGMAVW